MTMTARPLRVLLVDDQTLFRKGMEFVLGDWPDVQVVGEADNGLDAVHKVVDLRPDVVLMDINMPVMDGLQATQLILEESPGVKVIILSVSEQDENLFRAIRLGACGYLLKDLKPAVLHEMLMAAVREEIPISPLMTRKILDEYARQLPLVPTARPVKPLTTREKEVLTLVARGGDNLVIADRLSLTHGTVKRHVHNILKKLGAGNRGEAVAYAVHRGIIPPGPPR